MSFLVENAKSLFYRQLHKTVVKSLPSEEVRHFVKNRFELCGYKISDEAISKFIRLTHSIPDYVQRLGLIVSGLSKNITIGTIEQAYEEMLLELDSEFRETLSKLNQRAGTYGVILTGLSRYNSLSKAGRFVGYDLGGMMRQIAYLQKIGLIEKTGYGKYKVADPVFKDWLKRNFA